MGLWGASGPLGMWFLSFPIEHKRNVATLRCLKGAALEAGWHDGPSLGCVSRGPRHHGIVPLTTSCPKPSPSRDPKEAADEGPSNPGRHGDIAHLGWWHRAPPRTSSTSSDRGYLQPCFVCWFFFFYFDFLFWNMVWLFDLLLHFFYFPAWCSLYFLVCFASWQTQVKELHHLWVLWITQSPLKPRASISALWKCLPKG